MERPRDDCRLFFFVLVVLKMSWFIDVELDDGNVNISDNGLIIVDSGPGLECKRKGDSVQTSTTTRIRLTYYPQINVTL